MHIDAPNLIVEATSKSDMKSDTCVVVFTMDHGFSHV